MYLPVDILRRGLDNMCHWCSLGDVELTKRTVEQLLGLSLPSASHSREQFLRLAELRDLLNRHLAHLDLSQQRLGTALPHRDQALRASGAASVVEGAQWLRRASRRAGTTASCPPRTCTR